MHPNNSSVNQAQQVPTTVGHYPIHNQNYNRNHVKAISSMTPQLQQQQQQQQQQFVHQYDHNGLHDPRHYKDNQQQQQQQNAGQLTSPEAHRHHYPYNDSNIHDTSSSSKMEDDYARVNSFLGLLHQQRRHRSHLEHQDMKGSEWQRADEMMMNSLYHGNGEVLTAEHASQRKQQRRHAVRLPSDSKLL